ncbi:MAG: metallophosphoesterase [Clostridia bacterium]|nr:metallophosphoesterase [Clostridia bacterium]
MKIGLFTDPHYSRRELSGATRRPRLSYEKIGEALRAFREEGVGLVVCLGDLIDSENSTALDRENLAHIAVLLASSGIETYVIPGNHDLFALDRYRFSVLLNMPIAPLHKKIGDVDVILLDANYFRNGTAYDGRPGDWTDTMVPAEQVEWLKKELLSCGDKTYLFSHQLIDYNMEQHHVVENAEEICRILSDSGKVRAVFQGHYHHGGEHEIDGVSYVTLRAMCEGYENSYLIIEV